MNPHSEQPRQARNFNTCYRKSNCCSAGKHSIPLRQLTIFELQRPTLLLSGFFLGCWIVWQRKRRGFRSTCLLGKTGFGASKRIRLICFLRRISRRVCEASCWFESLSCAWFASIIPSEHPV